MLSSSSKCFSPLLLSLKPLVAQSRRNYASETVDPYRWPSHSCPTPYDILELPKGAPYSKHRYVELVKLYHPDLAATCPHAHLTEQIRVDRFRLAVAANSILSDSSKRSAYDRWGSGWHSADLLHPILRPGSTGSSSGHPKWWTEREGHEKPFASTYGRGGRDDPANNATWEDWERWHQRRAYSQTASAQQEEVFMKNGSFMALVLLTTFVGGMWQVRMAHSAGTEAVELTNRKTEALGADLSKRRTGTAASNEPLGKEERVRRFLQVRDPVGQFRSTPVAAGDLKRNHTKLLAEPGSSPSTMPSGQQRE